MYQAAFVNFTNCNMNRFLFYSKIHDYFSGDLSKEISLDLLMDFGEKSNLSKKQTKDEIIGCLYAPFLVAFEHNSMKYWLSYNGQLRFNEFFSSINRVETEFPLVLTFQENEVRFRTLITDVLDSKVEQIRNLGWSRNKARHRLTKKAKNPKQYMDTIIEVLDILENSNDESGDYIDLIRKYGRSYKRSNNIGCNIHSRFLLKSRHIEDNEEFLKEILLRVKKPVDWGGEKIHVDDFFALYNDKSKTGEIIDNVIKKFVIDGIIRYFDEENLTLTSTGYTAIRSYFSESKTLQVFISKKGKLFNIDIGEQKITSGSISNYLSDSLFEKENGWYKKTLSRDQLVSLFEYLYEYIYMNGLEFL